MSVQMGWVNEMGEAALPRKVKIKQVDAFTSQPFRGNPAGVVTEADGLDPGQMQMIAREMNLSETAFVSRPDPSTGADFDVRFFTPQVEVPFCGHATVATFFSLAEEGRLRRGPRGEPVTVKQHTGAGVLPVYVYYDQNGAPTRIMMEQGLPLAKTPGIDVGDLAKVLGVTPSDIGGGPIGLCYTGNWHMLVPLRLEAFTRLQPDLNRLGALNREVGVVTTHLYCLFPPGSGVDVHTRDFAPAVGLAEDPVTGSANGALAAFLALCAFDPDTPALWVPGANGLDQDELARFLEEGCRCDSMGEIIRVKLAMEQGTEIGRDGVVYTEVDVKRRSVVAVRAGGQAVTVIEGVMHL